MASLCDFTRDDGSVSRDQAVAASTAQSEGRLSQDVALTIIAAYNTDSTIDQCVSSPDPDPTGESTASVSIDSLSSPRPSEIVVNYTVNNTITSGGGETLSVPVSITVDGAPLPAQIETVVPGGSQSDSITVTDASAGEATVCVEV